VAGSPRPLSAADVESRLRARFGEDILEVVEQHGHAVASVSPPQYHDLCRYLREEPDFACDYCEFTTAVDFGAERGFEVVTHLSSTRHHHNVRIKVRVPHEEPSLPTISDLWATCDWNERETAEMFGIRFEAHPQPVKLLLSEPFEGYPLRKDFPLMTREAKPWPGAAEGEEEGEEE
jgi:NADH:ubiquinone oxidoreductase subunit C